MGSRFLQPNADPFFSVVSAVSAGGIGAITQASGTVTMRFNGADVLDADNWHDAGAGSPGDTRFIVPPGKAGNYFISFTPKGNVTVNTVALTTDVVSNIQGTLATSASPLILPGAAFSNVFLYADLVDGEIITGTILVTSTGTFTDTTSTINIVRAGA